MICKANVLAAERKRDERKEGEGQNNNIGDDDFTPFDAKPYKANYINHKLERF